MLETRIGVSLAFCPCHQFLELSLDDFPRRDAVLVGGQEYVVFRLIVFVSLLYPLIDGDGGGHRIRDPVTRLPVSDGEDEAAGIISDSDVLVFDGVEF